MSDDKAQQPGQDAGKDGKSIENVQPAGATPEQQMHGPVNEAMNVESPKLAPGEIGAEPVAASSATKPEVTTSKAAQESKASEMSARGQVMIMAPKDHGWRDDKIDQDPAFRDKGTPSPKRERRMAAYAAVALLALIAGAAGGAMATMAMGKSGTSVPATQTVAAEQATRDQTISRLEGEVAALRTSFEHAGKTNASQAAKLNDRVDRVEKAQTEPNAKLARLSDAVDKLRATPPAAVAAAAPAQASPAPAAPRDGATGSVQANAVTGQNAAPKQDVARLPTVEGWVLRDVADGGALIESRRGTYEVYAGDEIRGLGRVDAIRKQDGRWVVVTSKGLIVSR